jgi:hypothetical protein
MCSCWQKFKICTVIILLKNTTIHLVYRIKTCKIIKNIIKTVRNHIHLLGKIFVMNKLGKLNTNYKWYLSTYLQNMYTPTQFLWVIVICLWQIFCLHQVILQDLCTTINSKYVLLKLPSLFHDVCNKQCRKSKYHTLENTQCSSQIFACGRLPFLLWI